jgi:hypothetical protein
VKDLVHALFSVRNVNSTIRDVRSGLWELKLTRSLYSLRHEPIEQPPLAERFVKEVNPCCTFTITYTRKVSRPSAAPSDGPTLADAPLSLPIMITRPEMAPMGEHTQGGEKRMVKHIPLDDLCCLIFHHKQSTFLSCSTLSRIRLARKSLLEVGDELVKVANGLGEPLLGSLDLLGGTLSALLDPGGLVELDEVLDD